LTGCEFEQEIDNWRRARSALPPSRTGAQAEHPIAHAKGFDAPLLWAADIHAPPLPLGWNVHRSRRPIACCTSRIVRLA